MTRHASPFHCPFCGEQDLFPHVAAEDAPADERGAWECRGCLRLFTVRMLGMVRPEGVVR